MKQRGVLGYPVGSVLNPIDEEAALTSQYLSYWRDKLFFRNLTIWFVVGFVISIFFIEDVNTIKLGKIGLGFWFAQQGSIYVFIVLVFLYAIIMDSIDRNFELGDRS